METPESIRASLIPGEWVLLIDLSDAYLHIPIHPNSRKYLRFCHKSQMFQFTSLPFRLAMAPQVFDDCKRSEADCPDKGNQTSPVPGRLAYQGPVSGRSTSEHSESGRPDLWWIINQEKSELKPAQVFSFMGYEYYLDSGLVKPTQERWLKLQDLILQLK